MAKIWFKTQYNFSGYSGKIGGAPIGIQFYYGVASCHDENKLSWFRKQKSSFIVLDTEEELNAFERLDPCTLKLIAEEFGIEVKNTDTKMEYVAALMDLKNRIN